MVSRHKKDKPFWILMEQEMMGWQWRWQKGHPGCKNWVVGCWAAGMVIYLGQVQICIWPNWCHCHSLSLVPVYPDWLYVPGTHL